MTRTTIANIEKPLDSIMRGVKILHNQEKDEKKKTIMQICTRSSKMMLNHILDYKDYVADRENTFKSYREPFDVKKMVKEVVQMFDGLAKLKNIKINYEIGAGVPHIVMADKQRLMQVLRNYISNAFKFSLLISEGSPDYRERRKAGILVSVLYDWEAFEKKLIFYVKDRGIGLNEY
jgi:signal transduction histidine kinase